MKVVILGAGRVGGTLAESLSLDGHDISVVDHELQPLEELQQRLDIRTCLGQASYPHVLESAGLKNAEMLLATTSSDEINMVACQVAKVLFNTRRRIARIRSREYIIERRLLGTDFSGIEEFIHPEQLVADYIRELILHPGTTQALAFANGQVKMISFEAKREQALIGKTLRDCHPILPQARVVGIFRNHAFVELTEDTKIEAQDEIFIAAANRHINDVMATLRSQPLFGNFVMIMGAGHIGELLSAQLENAYQVKIIDHNRAHCEALAARLSKGTVLYGESSDRELLMNEGIEQVDFFCALTNDDEANILSCIQAKQLGAKWTMALVNRLTYGDLLQESKIDRIINPQHITISALLGFVHQGRLSRVYTLRPDNAVAVELQVLVHEEAPSVVVGQAISELSLPKGAQVAAVVRGGQVMVLHPDTRLQVEDILILFLINKEQISEIEQFFHV